MLGAMALRVGLKIVTLISLQTLLSFVKIHPQVQLEWCVLQLVSPASLKLD